MFTHEKFKAYQLAIEFTHQALSLIDESEALNASLRDQLKRAAFSISLNIAEGTGKTGRADRLRYYSIARGSAMECSAICDILLLIQPKFRYKIEPAKEKLKSIVNILSTVCLKKLKNHS